MKNEDLNNLGLELIRFIDNETKLIRSKYEQNNNKLDSSVLATSINSAILSNFKDLYNFILEGSTAFIYGSKTYPDIIIKVFDEGIENKEGINLEYINTHYKGIVPQVYFSDERVVIMEKIKYAPTLSSFVHAECEEEFISSQAINDLMQKIDILVNELYLELNDLHSDNVLIVNNEKAIIIDTAHFTTNISKKSSKVFLCDLLNNDNIIIQSTNEKRTIKDELLYHLIRTNVIQ